MLVNAGGDAFALDDDNLPPLQLALEEHEGHVSITVLKEAGALIANLKAEVKELQAELEPVRNLQALIVDAAAEMRRLERARAEQQRRELEWARREEALAQRVAECEQRERELSKRQRLA